jgi:hypothetical protein
LGKKNIKSSQEDNILWTDMDDVIKKSQEINKQVQIKYKIKSLVSIKDVIDIAI